MDCNTKADIYENTPCYDIGKIISGVEKKAPDSNRTVYDCIEDGSYRYIHEFENVDFKYIINVDTNEIVAVIVEYLSNGVTYVLNNDYLDSIYSVNLNVYSIPYSEDVLTLELNKLMANIRP